MQFHRRGKRLKREKTGGGKEIKKNKKEKEK
jgi:hypothetical protein